ncbi:MAG: FAD-binding protein [Deltaproteobacteria bacterium]|nr:FAD-binding protein [Deltaproteobacteria bacterium]
MLPAVAPRPELARPSPATVDRVRLDLDRALGASKLVTSPEGCLAHAGDESEQEPVAPDVVVLAASAEDVVRTFAVAARHGVPVTPRAGGSGKSGGCVPVCGGIVLSCLGMKAVKEIDRAEGLAVVEPGIVLAELYDAVEAEGLFYPPDPNSYKQCALGGNIAENASGPRALKYGVTRDYVLGLEVVTPDGTRLRCGHRTAKGVSGYDLTALLVGSEGTLAVTVEATLRLVRKPPAVRTLLALFDDVQRCVAAVAHVIASGPPPRCLEMMDAACLAAMRSQGVPVDEHAGAMLLCEVDGEPEPCERDMEALGGRLTDAGASEVLAAQDEAHRARLWAARQELTNVLRRLARHKVAEDVVVPRGAMGRLVEEVARLSERTGVRMLSYGHAGSGNLHVTLLWDEDEQLAQVKLALSEIFRLVVGMGGALTGEHGIGLSKAPYLALEQSAELIGIERRIKHLFDPQGILNPGKIFPAGGHGAC